MELLKFPENLREALKHKEMTQQELAHRLGTTQQTVSRWLNKICEPELSVLLEICMILDETPNELLGYDNIPDEVIDTYKNIKHK
ncbi:MAG: helix-turn-helix transcriptional regulator [Clostridiales bacterium]|nr:helix-turn-helix transcriptional regulator [Clostridiales bacterium]